MSAPVILLHIVLLVPAVWCQATSNIIADTLPGTLNLDTTFYWPVVAKNSAGKASSATWSFAAQGTSAAGPDFNGDGKPDILWRNYVTGQNGVWYMDGATKLGDSMLATVADLNWKITGTGDFNGDGKVDILWRNYLTGQNSVWYMDGVTKLGEAFLLPVPDLNWKIAGVGDFNADGKPDILWRNYSSGLNTVWYMNGITFVGEAYLITIPDLTWKIAGVGDFNGDNKPDILWRNSATGQNGVWYMDGVTKLGDALMATVGDLNWNIAGVGDYNGDGKPDILWRNYSTGQNGVWYMDGATKLGDALMATVGDLSWVMGPDVVVLAVADTLAPTLAITSHFDGQTVISPAITISGTATDSGRGSNGISSVTVDGVAASGGTAAGAATANWSRIITLTPGQNTIAVVAKDASSAQNAATQTIKINYVRSTSDFNNDGKPDILWRNYSTGQNSVWYMDGATKLGEAALATVGDLNWKIAGVADFNGDGKPDILWRNYSSGLNTVWYMNGVTFVGEAYLITIPDLTWKMAGVGDFNGDGKPDILWRNSLTGQNGVWYMNGVTKMGDALLATVDDLNWKIVGVGDFNGDNKPDILWRNYTTGQNGVWYMDGVTKLGDALLDTVGDLNWKIAGAADFNGDGKVDILWRHDTTGQNTLWYMNGVTLAGSASLPTVADVNWKIATDPTSAFPPPAIWQPALNTSWQWQLSTPVDQSVNAQLYNIDMFDNSASVVAALHAQGRKVICYINAGTWESWRPDASTFPSVVIGKDNGWAGEKWLDIRRLDILGPIMQARLDVCKARGFDGVEPDNVEGYSNNTGFPLTSQDQLNYNIFIANAAHARGLSVGLKNDLNQVQALLPYFDWALNEECFQRNECNLLLPFISAGKAVFEVEYALTTSQFCPTANAMNFNALLKDVALTAYRVPCR